MALNINDIHLGIRAYLFVFLFVLIIIVCFQC